LFLRDILKAVPYSKTIIFNVMNKLTLIAGSKGETLGRFKGYGGNRNPPKGFCYFCPYKSREDFKN